MTPLLIDVTEFVTNPIRTGIQRVIREMLAGWPAEIAKQVVWFDDRVGGLVPVGDDLLALLIESASDPYHDGERLRARSLRSLASRISPALAIGREDRVLIPELFASRGRALFYKRLHAQRTSIRAIVYDILAWTQPDALSVSMVGPFNDYIEVLRLADARCHISQSVCDDYTSRILRRASDAETVISLGADALGARPANLPVVAQLVFPGALDGRKGQDRVFDAYMAMPEKARLPLIIAGRIPREAPASMQRILQTPCPTVSIIEDPDDGQMATLIASSQGCLFPSQFEGFGLPALESLHLGTPVVVDARLPALSGLASDGQIRLASQGRDDLVEALMAISDRKTARRLRDAAATLKLPTWADYATRVANWATQ